MVFGPATSTWPRVTSKKRSTSATNAAPFAPSHGSRPCRPSWPRAPMAQIDRTSAAGITRAPRGLKGWGGRRRPRGLLGGGLGVVRGLRAHRPQLGARRLARRGRLHRAQLGVVALAVGLVLAVALPALAQRVVALHALAGGLALGVERRDHLLAL